MQALPIDPLVPRITAALLESPHLILEASPGSGKTTRVPPALMDEPWAKGKEIWVLVPRRLAAKMAALRVAQERNETVGQTVGYHFRHEKVRGPSTRLLFLTEGMLLRLVMQNPSLPQVAAVVLDEFHERHLHSDIALAYLVHLRRSKRPDLKIILMSATLQSALLSEYLDRAPVVKLEAPLHPVEISYLPQPPQDRLEGLVQQAVLTGLKKSDGDILVFLPGMAEIRRTEEKLKQSLGGKARILPLHGELPKEEQTLIFEKFPQPKIILSTNIAETSLTIEGVTTVIDSGLSRQASFSWWSGIPTLKTKSISQASAIQRAGRAGRTGAGRALRLYTRTDFDGRASFETPEIQRADLLQSLLEIKSLGLTEISRFPWFESPEASSLVTSARVLFELGATTAPHLDAPLTPDGKKMAALPLHPRLARLLLEAEKKGALRQAAHIAALLSEDELSELDVLHELEKPIRHENVKKLISQILSNFESASREPAKINDSESLSRALLAGFADRVAKKRSSSNTPEADLVFCLGGSAQVANDGVVKHRDYFVILDIQETKRLAQAKSMLRVQSLCPIEPEWLLEFSNDLLKETNEVIWDAATARLSQASRLCYGQLVLSETAEAPNSDQANARLLLEKALGLDLSPEGRSKLLSHDVLQGLSRFFDSEIIEEFFARWELLTQLDSSAEKAPLSGTKLADFLEKAFEGIFRLKEIDTETLVAGWVSHLPPQVQQKLEQGLPRQIQLNPKRRVRVHYRLGQKPFIASRLQDFFGLKKHPTLLNGRLPLLLHLLAPNQRAVQITQDLESFWKNAYLQIRKELSRKYPRHQWPENPLQNEMKQ